MRERAVARSRRIAASCGLARSSSSPLGRIFLLNEAVSFPKSADSGATISKRLGQSARSLRSVVRAARARSQHPAEIENCQWVERRSLDLQTSDRFVRIGDAVKRKTARRAAATSIISERHRSSARLSSASVPTGRQLIDLHLSHVSRRFAAHRARAANRTREF